MDRNENEEFTRYLRNAVKEAERLKYFPNRFKGMLEADGGYETVKRILASGRPSEGFQKLWELGRVDLTCEAIIVERRWRRFFDDDLLERAENLLRQVNYPFKRFESPATDLGPQALPAATALHEPDDPALHASTAAGRSSMRINAFFHDVLGAPVASSRWSWGAVDERRRRIFLRLWRMDLGMLEGEQVIRVLRRDGRNRHGWNERVRHLDLMKSGYAAYAVICDKEKPEAGEILDFDSHALLRLGRVVDTDDAVYAHIIESVSVAAIGPAGDATDALQTDLHDIAHSAAAATTKSALVDARLGQGRFRRELLRRWNGACAVTGCRIGAMLRASHCKPWRKADDSERLDSNNGLILTANIDALFDAGLIGFDADGRMLFACVVSSLERQELGLPGALRRVPNPRLRVYLEFHRNHVFLGS